MREGEALFAELLWVHRMVRQDLETVRGLAEHLLAHLEFEEQSIGPALRRLNTHPLWR